MGNAYKALGSYNQAIESYNSALKLNPKYVDAMCNLGNMFSFDR